ncbi:MAG TPA: Fic family protein [Steroidobacteraceae bacterium]|nr:Fic family protein [Steroidobacteraceae bacterium]
MADKPSIAELLKQHAERWNSPAEIKAEIADVPDRTLRRWLGELVNEGVIQRSGSRKGTRYRWNPAAKDEQRQMVVAVDADADRSTTQIQPVFSPESEQLLKRIDAPIYTRSPVTYSEEWVASYVPNETTYLTAEQRAQLHAQGKRSPLYGQAGTYIQKIYNRLLIDLSYNSARLEGNTYSLADTEHLVIQGESAQGKLDAERIMILNHKEAIRYLAQNVRSLTPNEETIRTLHYLLSDSLVAPGMAGQIRSDSIGVTGTTYAPLEGKERLTQFLNRVLNTARLIDDPFEQSLYLLGHVSYLQAFVDVNKRTARLASIIPLIAQDYVPQSFVDVRKDDYLKATIVFYELNDVRPLAELYCWAYRRSCLHFDTSVQVVGFDEIAALYRPQRRALVAELVRSLVPPAEVMGFMEARITNQVQPQHRDKFKQDVLAELDHLDDSRMSGLGITREQLQAWLKLS